jgi:isopentenyl-diphosphate Delta-isomerase
MTKNVEQGPVSRDDELLILVDEQDNVTGYESKINAHRGAGLLHRAFSVFLFDTPDIVLLQKRSATKPLWPLFWTNSCCSHPRKGEAYEEAAHRRINEELGVGADLHLLYQFQYSASFNDTKSERELCSVFIGHLDKATQVHANANEVADWTWAHRNDIDCQIRDYPERFTPWFLMEWNHLFTHNLKDIKAVCRIEGCVQ